MKNGGVNPSFFIHGTIEAMRSAERFCSLQLQQPVYYHEITDVCRETCGELWDKAIDESNVVGLYDSYSREGEAEYGCMAATENSDSALFATGDHERQIVLVDKCMAHGTETGEQGYGFRCPLPIQRP